jgi:hypothetical protein
MIESTAQETESPSFEESWALLERVVGCVQLRRAPRLREFLSYVGRRSLKDGCSQVHEQEIGIEVFGRPNTYDTSVDNIVRANATELRKRIESYFETEGLNETLLMEIPRGSYVPVFKPRPAKLEVFPEPRFAALSGVSESETPPAVTAPAKAGQRWMIPALIAAAVMIVALSITSVVFWNQSRTEHRALYSWQYSPGIASFWTGFLGSGQDTDIVMSDAFFKLAQDLTKRSYTLNDYLSRSYVTDLINGEKDPETQLILGKVAAWSTGNSNHLTLARRILALDPLGKHIHLYYARDYTPDLIKQNSVILLGSRVTNPWDSLFDGRLNFIVKLDNEEASAIINRSPAPGEQSVYTRSDTGGYCVVAYLPNPNGNGKVLMIEGTTVEATQAGGDFLLSESQMSSFQRMLHTTSLPYFEVLLKTSQVKGTPFTSTIQAYRVYSNLH